ncbi:hypothetical protein ACFFWC_15360 [Plantactinospora siamensis]|uniref:Uncharacterized protein n=1 Tax=Plantactinospora siamensis TaxID=555372 RepID=A0ABV6P0L1_9ACTN
MDTTSGPDDGAEVAASLAERLSRLTFLERSTDEVTELLAEAVAGWGRERGWRVYRRAASVLPLPPPYEHRRSVVDVACARPDGRPVVIEIDHGSRRRSVAKLLAEAAAGRVAVWVRWGERPAERPPDPVRLVTVPVTGRRSVAGERRYSRVPATDRPPPPHTGPAPAGAEQDGLFGAGAEPGEDRPGVS